VRLIKCGLENKSEDIRKKMIAKVHIAMKEANVCKLCGAVHFSKICGKCGSIYFRKMTEFDYKCFLLYATGKTSCKNMDLFELSEVLRFFESAGFEGVKKADFKKMAVETRKSMLKKLKSEAERMLGTNWKSRANGFCQEKLGVSQVDFCNIRQLRQVWAFLRQALKKGGSDEIE
jgi:hypothetical protein